MSAQLKPLPQAPAVRPGHVQVVLAGGVYAYLLRDSLPLYERDAKAIERSYGIPVEIQSLTGYRSVFEPLRFGRARVNSHLEAWLESLPENEFCDWFTYDKTPLYSQSLSAAAEDEYNLGLSLLEHALAERFGEIKGVPGLYVDDRLRVKLPRSGVLVPCRVDSIIRAILAYPVAGEDRRFWFSSNGLNGGAPARAALHVANEHRASRDRVAVVVSHAMQADSVAWRTGECVVATNGVSPLRLPRDLRAALPDLKGCMVLPELGDHVARTLRENGLRVRVGEVEGENES